MTFIQPNKRGGIVNTILALLSVGLVAVIFGMVGLYNATVNLNHSIANAKAKLDTVGAENTGLSNTIVATLGGDKVAAIVAQEGLVTESKPKYFQVSQTDDQKWPIASHY